MHKSRIKQKDETPAGWQEVILDAETEIAVCQARIGRLRRVIRGAEIQVELGVPFPADLAELNGQEG